MIDIVIQLLTHSQVHTFQCWCELHQINSLKSFASETLRNQPNATKYHLTLQMSECLKFGISRICVPLLNEEAISLTKIETQNKTEILLPQRKSMSSMVVVIVTRFVLPNDPRNTGVRLRGLCT